MPSLFPPTASSANRVIGVSASESRAGFAVHMSDVVPSLHAVDMVGSQYFPLYVYDTDTPSTESDDDEQTELFDQGANAAAPSARRDGITDAGLEHFRSAYPGETITKEDVFYYVYGILHSPEYRQRYADNLGKELPRIPRMKKATDFWAFSRAGRELGELHVGYEKVDEHPDVKVEVKVPVKAAAGKKTTGDHFRVEKMKFGKAKVDGKTVKDRTVIHYNAFVTVSNIPEDAYDYVVNGKPAIEWVMERQAVTKDKASGIVKDANDWARETMGDPRYPLSLLLRVIHVSVKTNALVANLPKLDILET